MEQELSARIKKFMDGVKRDLETRIPNTQNHREYKYVTATLEEDRTKELREVSAITIAYSEGRCNALEEILQDLKKIVNG